MANFISINQTLPSKPNYKSEVVINLDYLITFLPANLPPEQSHARTQLILDFPPHMDFDTGVIHTDLSLDDIRILIDRANGVFGGKPPSINRLTL